MLYKIGALKNFARFTVKHHLKRTFFTEHLWTTPYVEHLEGVMTRYCAIISTQIVLNRSFNLFSMFLIVSEMIFRLMIFNTFSHYCYLVIMAVALLTNKAVFESISLVKIEARRMLALFLRFCCLHPHPPTRF